MDVNALQQIHNTKIETLEKITDQHNAKIDALSVIPQKLDVIATKLDGVIDEVKYYKVMNEKMLHLENKVKDYNDIVDLVRNMESERKVLRWLIPSLWVISTWLVEHFHLLG